MLSDDDTVEVMLDTFHDRRRAYAFQINPLGVQWDAIWSERLTKRSAGTSTPRSTRCGIRRASLTPEGYVAWMAIPFKSLRFPPTQSSRGASFCTAASCAKTRIPSGRKFPNASKGGSAQAATLTGLEGISPGRNIQLIPYGLLNSFRDLDTRDPAIRILRTAPSAARFGLDSKIILNDSLVLDLTANPDFSQVESEDPQVTVNQRFAVYFPEKRPFFIENADYFRTPIDLFFTRQIANPVTARGSPERSVPIRWEC